MPYRSPTHDQSSRLYRWDLWYYGHQTGSVSLGESSALYCFLTLELLLSADRKLK